MCILIAARRAVRDGGFVVAANRDELLARPWQRPRLIVDDPPVFGGVDVIGGGSWLAVNLAGRFVVGVTNARLGARPGRRSRGTLVVDLAAQATSADAVALLSELDLSLYGAFNILLADEYSMWLASNAPTALSGVDRPVAAIGNDPLDEPSDRVRFAADSAAGLLAGEAGDTDAGLRRLLSDHEGKDPLCRHGERYGTVCSTMLTVSGRARRYLFAGGPPCVTPFEPLDLPVPRVR